MADVNFGLGDFSPDDVGCRSEGDLFSGGGMAMGPRLRLLAVTVDAGGRENTMDFPESNDSLLVFFRGRIVE
jgi:hypothetical protein